MALSSRIGAHILVGMRLSRLYGDVGNIRMVCMAADECVPGGEWPARGKARVEYSNLWIWTLAGGCGGGDRGGKAVGWLQCCYDSDVNANSRRQMNGLTRNRRSIHEFTWKTKLNMERRERMAGTQKENMFTAFIKTFHWTYLHLRWESIITAWTRFLLWKQSRINRKKPKKQSSSSQLWYKVHERL